MSQSPQRVVVTGLGMVSSIGSDKGAVVEALRQGRSGLVALPEMERAGMSCHVYAPVRGWNESKIPKRARQTMAPVAGYAAAAAQDAVRDADLDLGKLNAVRAGAIVGTVFGGVSEVSRMHALLSAGRKSRAGGVGMVKFINSTASGNLAAMLGLKGRAYSVSTSFASGLDNVGHAYELIRQGVLDVAVCGGSEEQCRLQVGPYFENLGVLPKGFNDRPAEACRPYDADRQGVVLSAGAGICVLESLEHAERRSGRIYAEIVAYAATNDGDDMFRPSGEGLARAIRKALAEAAEHGVERIDYVNSHATGTPAGDAIEAAVLRDVIGNGPLVSSTKGLSGHALGAAGSLELTYSLLMMSKGFVAPTANLRSIAPECGGLNHVQTMVRREAAAMMCLSVGIGGFNSCVMLGKTGKV